MATVYIGTTPIRALLNAGHHLSVVIGASLGDLEFTVNPVISGTLIETSVLTSDDGTVTGTAPISYSFQWLRDGVNIEGPPVFTSNPVLEVV